MSSAATAKYGKGFIGFFKKWWDLRPEHIATAVIGLLGVGVGISVANYYTKNNLDNRKYKKHYTVYRYDDPRVGTIRKD